MLSMRFPGGAAKALTLSYDDGVEQDVRLIDILDRAGIRCTFNLKPQQYEIFSNRQMKKRPASSSLMKSIPSAKSAIPAQASVATMSGNRRSISCSPKWTALTARRAL